MAKDGSPSGHLSEVCDGLYRSDEQHSGAVEAYDNAFEEGVGGGFGAWRLTTEYEDEDDEENEFQRIRLEPIFDADQSVFFDLNAKRQDKADAKHCFVITGIDRETYEAEYDDDVSSWPTGTLTRAFDWATADVVYIAEYYVVKQVKYVTHVYRAVDGLEEEFDAAQFEDDPTLAATLEAKGSIKVREKSGTRKGIHKYILSGGKVLDDMPISGSHIPVVPFYGKRWFVDGIERSMGHVRLAKDAQRLKNMQLSKLAEISASSSVQKPIFTPEQIAGHGEDWANDNVANKAYLLVNPMTDLNGQPMPAGPIGYTKPPEVDPATAALIQMMDADMQEVLGNQGAGEEIRPNVSGKAIELVQNKLDMQTFIYMSNMSKAVKRSGEIWLSMARDVYVEDGRRLKLKKRRGDDDSITLGEKIVDSNGEVVSNGDLSKASFDVSVTVGPSSDSKRAASVRAITGMMTITQDPETLAVLGALALDNMEGEGIEEVREWNRKKLVKMGVYEPNDDDLKAQQEAQPQGPTPQDAFLAASADKEKALAEKAAADTELSRAKADGEVADAMKTLSEISQGERQELLGMAKELDDVQQVPAPPVNGARNGLPPGLNG